MKIAMVRAAVAGACAAGLLAFAASVSLAQGGAAVQIYDGGLLEGSGITATAWGSGAVKEVNDPAMTGVRSLELKTQGVSEGLRVVLAHPADVSAASTDPDVYLRVGVQLGQDKTQSTTFGGVSRHGFQGAGGSTGDDTNEGVGGAGVSFARGGANSRRSSTGQYGGGTATSGTGTNAGDMYVTPQPITAVRVVVVTTDGKQCEAYLPLANASYQRNNWMYVAVPLSKLVGFSDTDKQIKEVRVCGNSVGTLYVGNISTVRDTTPISVDPLDEQTVAVNDIVTFTGNADGGTTQLKYQWWVLPAASKIADSNLPAVPDLEGRTVRFFFRKSGDYNVTLKVSDVNGIKKPVFAHTKVTVTL